MISLKGVYNHITITYLNEMTPQHRKVLCTGEEEMCAFMDCSKRSDFSVLAGKSNYQNVSGNGDVFLLFSCGSIFQRAGFFAGTLIEF
jgi:hypothetical protein